MAAKAQAAGAVTVTDAEGAPVAVIVVADESTAPAVEPGVATVATVALGGEVRAAPADADAAGHGGAHASLRLPPAAVTLDRPLAIIGHDPTDAATLTAVEAEPARPVLFVVFDGPRITPGPEVTDVATSALVLRAQFREQGRAAEVVVVVVPAPSYGDDRDDVLADRVATAYGARRVVARRRPDATALHSWLDGSTAEPDADWPASSLSAWRRWRPLPVERGLVVLFTGLSGSGKSTVARAVTDLLMETGARKVTLLDGDVVRRNLSAGLGFSREDRDRNVERIGYVAAEIARHGGVAICAPIAPFASTRAPVRQLARAHGGFILVHVATPLAECERRDRKGLYARARAGQLPDFTGISSPYETPDDADLILDTSRLTIAEARDQVIDLPRGGGWLGSS